VAEQKMVDAVQQGLEQAGIDDRVIAAGQFNPRGHSGGMVAGAMVGGDAGGIAGAAGGAAGFAGGGLAASIARGLPENMVVGVGEQAVYGFKGIQSRVGELVFTVPREGLEVNVHQRIDVKVLELVGPDGAKVELEGNRLPLTHSKDVFEALAG